MPDNQNSSEWEPRPMASDVEKRIAKALLSARTHIGSCRPDYDEDDAAWWDELTELAALVTQPAASGEVACAHEYRYGAGIDPYCIHCGINEAEFDSATPQPSEDTVRLDWLADNLVIEGFVNVKADVYKFATTAAEENGREEPTKDDVRIGLRRLIDAAITGEKL